MNFKIVFKQIYKGFFKNWKLFAMLIVFCSSILALIFGSLSFAVQFKNEVYNPAISKKSFSVGFLNNNFTYFEEENSNFKTNQEFESYFLEKINSVLGEPNNYEFEYKDLKEIYLQDGYVNWVNLNQFNDKNRIIAYHNLIDWSSDFLGNVRFKVINQYVQEKTDWTFTLRNNQGSIAKVNSFSPIHLYSLNLTPNNLGVINIQQLLKKDSEYIPVYISEKQLNYSNNLGDIVTLNLFYQGESKKLKAEIVGTFTDYLTFSEWTTGDSLFLLNNTDYFKFVEENFKNEDGSIDYSIIDYRNTSYLSQQLLNLVTGEEYLPLAFNQQFGKANNVINKLLFDNFSKDALNSELSLKTYLNLYQRNIMITFVMISISILLVILFFVMFYFLIAQSIKKDFQLSLFLNSLGISYWEISLIQVARLLFPIMFSTCFSILLAFLTKQLFWSAFSSSFSLSLKLFYFDWETGIIFLLITFGIFIILLLINFLINQKLARNKNSIDQVVFINKIWIKGAKIFKVHRSKRIATIAFGAKNTFQNLFVFLISLIIFTISGFSINFIQNVNQISNIPLQHYKPIQSISTSSGSIVAKTPTFADENYVTTYSFNETKKLTAIGDYLDLKNDSFEKIRLELEHLKENDISDYYLSHNLVKQLDKQIIDKINNWDFDEKIKNLINHAFAMKNELQVNFAWNEGFNINFGQWTKENFSEADRHFLSLEGILVDAATELYLGRINHAFAVNPNDEYFSKEFRNLTNLPREKLNLVKNSKYEVSQTINAYFPISFKKVNLLKLEIDLNHDFRTEIYIKNVGINQFDNWDQIFILNKQQLFEFLESKMNNNQKEFGNFNPLSQGLSKNIDQIDNGVYSTNNTPYFYRNILLRSDGKGKKLENFFNSSQELNIYGLNFSQIKEIIINKLSQFNQLIVVVQVLLIILMFIVLMILIYLVVKENENYFKNFKALGYTTQEISFFLLPWYLSSIIFAGIIASLVVIFTTNLVDQELTNSLVMYLNYNITSIGIVFLIILPLIFATLIFLIIYQFINKVSIKNLE